MIVFLLFSILLKGGVLSSNVIDVDDILSEDFMPSTLLVLENPKTAFNNLNTTLKENPLKLSGSLDNAINLMYFHRTKMNEYLCRSYVAEQIVNDIKQSRIKRKMDTGGTKTPQPFVKNLLTDEGSSNYKDWLSKSTTLEDIYRHYNNINDKLEHKQDDENEKDEEEYDGQVVGYTFHSTGSPAKLGHSGGGGGYYSGGGYQYNNGYPYHQGGYGTAVSGHGSGTGGGHMGYGVHEEEEHHHMVHEVPKYHIYHEEKYSSKEHDLTDLFEIALTALAFLSFGMFVIHVIMCITMTNSTTTTTMANMMMPMSLSPTATGTGTGTGGTAVTSTGTGTGGSTATGEAEGFSVTGTSPERGDTIKFRFRRNYPTITNPNNQVLNELARRILTSIDAALIANEDNGNCLRKTLCENNKFSRDLSDKYKKYLIPLWSLGMSWMSGRLIKNISPATSMLDSLKASIIGLGNGNCEIIYQNCDIKKSKKQRKKRDVINKKDKN